MNQSYRFIDGRNIRGSEYKYEQANGQIVDDINGRLDIKSKGDEIEVDDKELRIMVW